MSIQVLWFLTFFFFFCWTELSTETSAFAIADVEKQFRLAVSTSRTLYYTVASTSWLHFDSSTRWLVINSISGLS
ncbi:hypothetical protein J3F84DRAFT_381399 [Trichoderma pleuroticola]